VISNDCQIKSKKEINLLGITFDSQLQWSKNVTKEITKANRALNALKFIGKYFSTMKLLQVISSNYY
jgi:hypothetical protein